MTPKQLSQWLKKHKLSLSDAAEVLCKHRSMVSKMKNGKAKISASVIQLMKFYDLSAKV